VYKRQGFIYLAGNFNSSDLVAHRRGDLSLNSAHRMRVSVALRGQKYEWIAPFELESAKKNQGLRGRLTGFLASEAQLDNARPVKDFRGWIWQKAQCNEGQLDNCAKNSFFSLRLPIAVLQDALFEKTRPVWPPADLAHIQVELQVLPPNSDEPLFDSRRAPSAAPFSLQDLQPMLLPGEVLHIKKLPQRQDIVQLTGSHANEDESWQLLTQLIRRLPVDEYDTPLAATEIITTPLESYEITLHGDVRSVSKSLSIVATRMAWFVGAMLLALFFAWLLIEISLIRRISKLTKRAFALSKTVKDTGGLTQFEISDLRSSDEMGLLASCLHDLLRRVKEDVEREGIRAEQEKQMWHAVGHEIMSPLQSLMVLHAEETDPSQRYIHRMQQAIRVLYGSASPSEAFQSTVLQVSEIEIQGFLHNVAGNAHFIGIEGVIFVDDDINKDGVMVRADEYSLEDVVTHVLRNAERFRAAGTDISIGLNVTETAATISIHNQGPQIAQDMLEKIFEYGVSDQLEAGAHGNRGQGLFVAKTYMAKMGGTIAAQNVEHGVVFVLSLQRGIG
jgi:signal transduction histidine kinase